MIEPARLTLAAAVLALLPHAALAQATEEWRSWNQKAAPFRVIGNVYSVGANEITVFLVATPEGHVLINSGFEETVRQVRENMAALGFKFADVKFLLSGQAHFDHAAGHPLIREQTGAKVVVSAGDAPLIEAGGRGDFFFGDKYAWRRCKVDRVIADGGQVTLGGTTLVAHLTPGHTKGCTTWTMKASEGGRSYDVVFLGGTTVNPGVRLVGNDRYPGIAEDYARTFRVLAALPCDVFLGAHASYYGGEEKAARLRANPAQNPFIDPEGYKAHVARARQRFEEQLAKERAAP